MASSRETGWHNCRAVCHRAPGGSGRLGGTASHIGAPIPSRSRVRYPRLDRQEANGPQAKCIYRLVRHYARQPPDTTTIQIGHGEGNPGRCRCGAGGTPSRSGQRRSPHASTWRDLPLISGAESSSIAKRRSGARVSWRAGFRCSASTGFVPCASTSTSCSPR